MATATKKAPAKRSSAKAEQGKAEQVKAPAAKAPDAKAPTAAPRDEYELPVVHAKVPAGLVEAGFWSALGGAALVGMIDPPVAIVIGAGVLVARHHLRNA